VRGKLQAEIGRHVRDLREAKRWSQETLAERAGLHRNYVGSVERGERDISVTALARLVEALGLSLVAFFANLGHRSTRR
jgi:transcriptional regulator with XRE-family HTH domain